MNVYTPTFTENSTGHIVLLWSETIDGDNWILKQAELSPELRTCKKITDAFDGPIAPHLRLLLNRQILTVVHYSSGLTQSSQPNLRHP